MAYSHIPIDPACTVVINRDGEGASPLDKISLSVRSPDGAKITVPLTNDMLNDLVYHCALIYFQKTRKYAFKPNFLPPLDFEKEEGVPRLPPVPAAPVAPVRKRTRAPAA